MVSRTSRWLVAALVALGAGVIGGSASAATPRVTVDRPGTTGLRVHLVYMVSKGFKDRHYDTDGSLVRAADQLQSWFRRETGGRQLRLDTYKVRGRDVADVTFVRSARTSFVCTIKGVQDQVPCVKWALHLSGSDPVDLVQQDLAAAGLKDPQVRYLVLVEGFAGAICGQSQEPDDGDRDPTHVGHVAAVFLGDSSCPNDNPGAGGLVTWAMAHEYLHNDGAVPLGAPHGCPPTRDHVCTAGLANGSPITDGFDPERADIMYPSPGIPLTAAHLDLGHDDYYGTTVGLRDVEDSPYLTPKR